MILMKMAEEVGTEVELGEEEHHSYGPEVQKVNYMLSCAWMMKMRRRRRNRERKKRVVCSWNQRMDHPTHDP